MPRYCSVRMNFCMWIDSPGDIREVDMLHATASLSRREVLCRIGGGIGALGLAGVFADAGLLCAALPKDRAVNPLSPRAPHFTPRAKRIIFLFMNGGPSHVDTFDPKPAL